MENNINNEFTRRLNIFDILDTNNEYMIIIFYTNYILKIKTSDIAKIEIEYNKLTILDVNNSKRNYNMDDILEIYCEKFVTNL